LVNWRKFLLVKRANILKHSALLLTLALTFSCRKVFDRTEWHPSALFPIANTDLTLNNLVTDTSLLKTDTSGLATLVFRQKLDSLGLDVLDTFSAPPFYRNFKLDSLRLAVDPFKQTTTLAQIARAMFGTENDLLGRLILSFHGKKIASDPLLGAFVPNTIAFPLGAIPVSLDQFFQSAVLRSGTLNLKVRNGLPMKIDAFDFAVKNANLGNVLIQETGIQIDTASVFERSYDLAGKEVEGSLNVDVSRLVLLVDKNVPIDTNSFVDVEMKFENIQVISATAIFPNQDVVTDRQAVSLENMGEMELKEAVIEQGRVIMDVTSTMQDSIFMSFVMPKTTYQGAPLVFNGVVPPAPAGGSRTIRLEVPVNDYNLNLSSAPDYFNRFLYDFKASVKYTGKKVFLSLNDSIEVNVYMKSMRPRYVRGYLGSLDTTIAASVMSDVLSKIQADFLSPEKVNVSLIVSNGLGINGTVKIDQLKATNASGKTVLATDPALIGTPLNVLAATEPPFTEKTSVFVSSTNSNFPEFVGLLPNQFDYQIAVKVGGLPKDSNSFVYNTSKLKPEMEIQIPLNVAFQGLVLRDTLPMTPGTVTFETNGGSLNLVTYNGFPFSARVKTTFLLPTGEQIGIEGQGQMAAADVNPGTGRSTGKKYSKIELPFSDQQLNQIALATSLIIEARFDTPPNQKVKIYSDYSAQMSLTAKIVPKLSR
jgi:hypothetical protein